MSTAVASEADLDEIQQRIHGLSAIDKRRLYYFLESEISEETDAVHPDHLAILQERARQVEAGEVKPVSSEEMARRLGDLLK